MFGFVSLSNRSHLLLDLRCWEGAIAFAVFPWTQLLQLEIYIPEIPISVERSYHSVVDEGSDDALVYSIRGPPTSREADLGSRAVIDNNHPTMPNTS